MFKPKSPLLPALYTVRLGDNPASVAAQYNLSPAQLLAANPGVTSFFPGMQIKFPGKSPSAPGGAYVYNVASGTSPSSPGGAYVYGNPSPPSPIMSIVPGGGFGSGVDIFGITQAGRAWSQQQQQQRRQAQASAPNQFRTRRPLEDEAGRAAEQASTYIAQTNRLPPSISENGAAELGMTTAEMIAAGYTFNAQLEGGTWIHTGPTTAATAPPTPGGSMGGGGGYTYYRRGGGGGHQRPKPKPQPKRKQGPVGLTDWRVSTG